MHQVKYGTQVIAFSLQQVPRKTLAIEVHPDGSVHVIAPAKATQVQIEEKVLKRARWIKKQQEYFQQFLPTTPKREYVSGETHFYAGKRYILKILLGKQESVKLKGGVLLIQTKNPSKDKIKALLASWYYKQAKQTSNRVFQKAINKFKEVPQTPDSVELKRMKKRWGTCTPENKIAINPELIKAASMCMEYVMVHELCHIQIPNHSKEFYKLLEEKMPDYKKWKLKLEQTMA
ncbi:M48 family metallopeptidase [Rasiella sp. SM2506]|uniref:M48 family metallopeptidase n=1 Tax=Rasiella sp. SM2506 TaxID=3423914 RepID=UPI003D7BF858